MLSNILFGVRLAAIALVVFFQTLDTQGAWGDLDTSFGFQGVAFDNVTGHYPRSVTLQPDGKILVTGYRVVSHSGERFFLRRYMPNGQLDTAFGMNGAAISSETNSLTTKYRGDAILVHPNGKISVVGYANGYYAVWQFNSSGRADRTFDVDGLVILNAYPTNGTHFPEINLQMDKVLLSLRKQIAATTALYRIALVRLTTAGAPDASFGNSGESLTDIAGATHYASGTVVESDNKITIGGEMFSDGSKGLDRKLANGLNDAGFSPPTVPANFFLNPGLVKMFNGKYAMRDAVLVTEESSEVRLVLEKFSLAGVFESDVMPETEPANAYCPDIFANQNDGKLVVGFGRGLYRTNSELDAASVERTACSGLQGIVSLGRGAIRPDDKLVSAGVYNEHLALVRLLPN